MNARHVVGLGSKNKELYDGMDFVCDKIQTGSNILNLIHCLKTSKEDNILT